MIIWKPRFDEIFARDICHIVYWPESMRKAKRKTTALYFLIVTDNIMGSV